MVLCQGQGFLLQLCPRASQEKSCHGHGFRALPLENHTAGHAGSEDKRAGAPAGEGKAQASRGGGRDEACQECGTSKCQVQKHAAAAAQTSYPERRQATFRQGSAGRIFQRGDEVQPVLWPVGFGRPGSGPFHRIVEAGSGFLPKRCQHAAQHIIKRLCGCPDC